MVILSTAALTVVDNVKGNRVDGSKKASFRCYAQVGLDCNFDGEETVPRLGC